MVFIKITDGIEARRFQVTPGEITFQQLREKIDPLFPGAVKEASSLVLRYRDSDGDLITLSSDEEFQEVLSDLPSNHVWKLHIYTPPKDKEEARPRHKVSLLDHLLQPPCTVRRNPWADFDIQLKETQELLSLFFGLGDTKQEEKTTSEEKAKKSTSEEKTEASTSEGTAETEASTSEETVETSENQDSENTEEQKDTKPHEATPKEGDGEEVKSKHPEKKASGSECPAGHHCQVKRIHLWEPSLFGGLFGPRVFGPRVEYHITWAPKSQSTAASSA